MALLNAAQLAIAKTKVLERVNLRESYGINKTDLDTLISNIDVYADGELPGALNTAITPALRGNLTDPQELLVLKSVLETREEEGVS